MLIGILILMVALALVPESHAGQRTYTWNGGGTNGNWNNPTNWNTNALTLNNRANLIFAGTNRLTNTNSAVVTIRTMTFNSTAGAFVISGTNITIQNAAGIVNNSTNTQTINLNNIALNNAMTFNAAAGQLDFGSSFSGNQTKTFTGSNNIIVRGGISGSGGVVKNGAGTLTLAASNSFTGGLNNNAGTLRAISNNFALGAGNLAMAGGNLIIANDTAMAFTNSVVVSANATFTSDRLTAGAGLTHSLGLLTNGAQTLTFSAGTNVTSGTAGITFSNVTLTAGGASYVVNTNTLLTLGSVGGNTFSFSIGGDGNASITGVVSNTTGSLTKTGSGTLTLGSANTYGGQTVIGGGVVVATNLANAGSSSSLGTNGTIVFSNSGGLLRYVGSTATNNRNYNLVGASGGFDVSNSSTALTLSGVISNTGALLKAGAGTLVLTGSNTYTGGASISAGVLQVGAGGTSGSLGAGNVTNSGTLLFNRSDNIIFSNVLSGSGSLVKDGAGTLIVTANNAYTGGTLISTGTLQVGNGANAGTIATTSAITNNGTLRYSISNGTRTLTSPISGTGNFVLDSPGGTVTLQASNSYSGGTRIVSGRLIASTNRSLGTGTLTLAGTNATNVAELSYANTNSPLLTGAISLEGNARISLTSGSSITSSGVVSITNTNNFISLAGNTWNEGTNTLITGTSISLLSGTNNIFLTGPTLNNLSLGLGSTTNIGRAIYTFNTNATSFFVFIEGVAYDLLWTGAQNTAWNTNATNWRQATNGTNPVAPDIDFNTGDNVWFGNAATNGPITVDTTNGVAAGRMTVTNTAGTVVINGGSLAAVSLYKSNAGALIISNVLDLEGGVFTNAGSGNVTLAGAWTNGALLQAGAGTVTLSVSNSYAGGNTISNGTVVAGANYALGSGDVSINGGGTLSIGTTTQQIDGLVLADGSITGTGTITGNDFDVRNGTITANLAGSADLVKTTAGTVTLSGTNTYTGVTAINGGTLEVGANVNLGATNSALIFGGSGGTLRVTNGFTTGRSVSFNSAGTFDVTTGALTLTGALDGAGSFGKAGAGTLVLATTANNQSGGMLISGGVLQVGNGGADGSLGTGNITNNAGLVFNRTGALTVNNQLSGSGALTNLGTGTVTLGGSNSYSGATVIGAGAVRAANSSALGTTAGATVVSNGAALELSGGISIGNESLTIGGSGLSSGGALRNIGGDNVYGGLLTLTTNTRVNVDAGSLSLTNTGTITGTGFNVTFGGAGNASLASALATGSGNLAKEGAGTLVLTGSNSYTGSTLISAGVLQVGAGSDSGSIGTTSAITNNGQLYYAVGSGTRTLNAPISGTGSVVVDMPGGTLTLGGSNTYSGGTTNFGGTVVATATNSLGSGALYLGGPSELNLAQVSYSLTNAPLRVGAITLDGASQINLQSGSFVQSSGSITVNDFDNYISISGIWGAGTNTLIRGTSISISGVDTEILLTGSTLGGAVLTLGSSTTIGRSSYTFNTNATNFFLSVTGVPADVLWTGNSNNIWNTVATNWVIATNGVNLGTNTTFFANDNVYFGSNATTTNISVTNTVSAGNMFVTNTNGTVRFGGGSGTISVLNLTKNGAGDLIISNTLDVRTDGTNTGVFSNTGSGNVTLDGAWTNGTLVQSGAGTLTLSVSNSYAGGSTISNGTVVAGAGGALGSGSVTVSGGTVDVGSTSQNVGQVTLNTGTISGSGTITSTNTFLVRTGSVTANLAGSVGLTKETAGTVTLSGSNSYTGNTTIAGGTLQVGADSNLGATNGNIVFDTTGGTLRTTNGFASGRSVTFTGAGTFDVATSALTLSGNLSGAGLLTKSGAGTLVLTGATNSQSGGTLISAGVLQVGNGGTNGSLGTGAVTNNAGLVFNRSNTLTVSNKISGSGTLTNSGTGTLTLTGSNTYTGQTVVAAGTMVLSNTSGNAIGNSSSIRVDSGATLVLGADNQIGDSTGLILNGGTFVTGTSSAGYSDTLGTLTLSASSTIDLGSYTTGLRQLVFANSSAIVWATNAVLTITNWQGLALQSSEVSQILFGMGGLTSQQLAQIRFANQDINGGVLLGPNGELSPIPEPRIYVAAAALLGFVGWRERKRLAALLRRRATTRDSARR